ncbi:globin [Elysia marginata]|uniref:Globin n=1 Tax=Elysia marginata TaxID=1093978 RepID=A0AAV4FXA5_9GAST|nr:globin [Elysia marginata]
MADPVTGLTARDRQVILDTWEVVGNKAVIRDRAVDLFIALFEAHPYMQAFFKDFKDDPLEELKTSPKLRTHAIRTMYGLKQYMDNLNDVPTLAGLITKMAENHLPRGIGTLEMDFVYILRVVDALSALFKFLHFSHGVVHGVKFSLRKREKNREKQNSKSFR